VNVLGTQLNNITSITCSFWQNCVIDQLLTEYISTLPYTVHERKITVACFRIELG